RVIWRDLLAVVHPARHLITGKYHRHSGMPWGELRRGLGRYQGAGQQWRIATLPNVPQGRHGQRMGIVGNQPWLLAAALCAPLQKAGHWDNAPLTFEGLAECPALGQVLGLRVEHRIFRADFRCPTWRQAPRGIIQRASTRLGDGGGGRNVGAWRRQAYLDAYHFEKFLKAGRVCYVVPSTHGVYSQKSRRIDLEKASP